MKKTIEILKYRWKEEGFNNHEDEALKNDYFTQYLPNYCNLKLKLLNYRDLSITDSDKLYYNSLRVYVYSSFENYCYVSKIINFKPILGQDNFFLQYKSILPAFSSLILNLGATFFLTYQIPAIISNKESNGLNSDVELYKLLISTNISLISKYVKDSFSKVLSSDEMLRLETLNTYALKLLEFRNFFTHRLRLPWWKNSFYQPYEYCIPIQLYDLIKDKQSASLIYKQLLDTKNYENEIITCTDKSKLISSTEILIDFHDTFVEILNIIINGIDKRY